MKEIERKFLVKRVPCLDDKYVYKEIIEQYYLGDNPEIRIRRVRAVDVPEDDAVYYMTIKSEGNLVRDELEFQIYPSVYNQLKAQVRDNKIVKTRCYLPCGENIATLDIYHDVRSLVTVEVEFESVDEANAFTPPEWFGKEVTNDWRYKNKNLAKKNGAI